MVPILGQKLCRVYETNPSKELLHAIPILRNFLAGCLEAGYQRHRRFQNQYSLKASVTFQELLCGP